MLSLRFPELSELSSWHYDLQCGQGLSNSSRQLMDLFPLLSWMVPQAVTTSSNSQREE